MGTKRKGTKNAYCDYQGRLSAEELQKYLKEHMVYEPDTGHLRRVKSPTSGVEYASKNIKYIGRKLLGSLFREHQLVFVYFNGRYPRDGYMLDHINGNTHDNRIENLREVTARQNQRNKKAKHIYRGVLKNKNGGYRVFLGSHYLGDVKRRIDGVYLRDMTALRVDHEHCTLNLPIEFYQSGIMI